MDIKSIGEFGLIELLGKDTIYDTTSVTVGIGDDAAALVPSPGKLQIVTTDMLVEGVHFDLTTTTPRQLGHKSLAVNLSDIAAMGGAPRHALVSIGLPQETKVEFVLELYQGMKKLCREFRVNIVGGDTVSSPGGLIINVVAIGEVSPEHLTKRSGARPGDVVAVTGPLGNSAAGLELLTAGLADSFPGGKFLAEAHLLPMPRVFLGQNLAAAGASAMDDISDGLASEAHEIAAASGTGIELYAAKIPLSSETVAAAAHFNKSALNYALYGGEDFELLFTMPPDIWATIPKSVLTTIHPIGRVVDSGQVRLFYADGTSEKITPKGYNHFR